MHYSMYVAIVMFVGFFLCERKKFYVSEIRNNLIVLYTVLILVRDLWLRWTHQERLMIVAL